jgi:exodeoxyribonuclease V beta subunit
MTVHLSKGLEADVVFLYGGTYGSTNRDDLVIYHDGNERKFAIGKDVQNIVKEHLAREENEENQRLLYVALTRARAKLYLPFFPPGSIKKPNGYYSRLNDRLGQIVSDLAITKRSTDYCSKLFTIDDVCASRAARAPRMKYHPLSEWSVPAELLKEDAEPESIYTTIRKARAPMSMHSYTSLKRRENAPHWDIAPEEFNADLEPSVQAADLPGGSQVGIFLHDVLERVDLTSFGDAPEFNLWREQDHVKELFEAAMLRHQIREQRWLDRGHELVYNALTARFAVTGGRIVGPLYACPNVRELEFLYPIPEGSHPILAQSGDEKWIAERGYLKGFVDFVFEQDGLVYFADWKSDLLTSYEPSSVQEHVMRNYELQARIYSVGVMRLLRIRSEAEYRGRFGGLLYIFLRGIESESVATRGIYFHRPQWTEVCRNERELIQLPGLV